jgi:hypothetical protein
MSQRWAGVDQLVRELGGLRVWADRIARADTQRTVVAAAEAAISSAAEAVSRTIDAEDEEALILAWEAIVQAQDVLARAATPAATGRGLRRPSHRPEDLRRTATALLAKARTGGTPDP